MRKSGFFWVSYADLMTSMFFVMLVLYVVSYLKMKVFHEELLSANKDLKELLEENEKKEKIIKVQAEKFQIIQSVEKNLEPLKKGNGLFVYESKYKRYRLAFDVQYTLGSSEIKIGEIEDYYCTIQNLDEVGLELKNVIERLRLQRQKDIKYLNISYLIVVSGSASDLPGNDEDDNYRLSYNRAYNLYKYWKLNQDIDFDDERYHDFVEFQIAGNGIGGIGRFPCLKDDNYSSEQKNQRFLINIIPKIGEL